jgi:hypothetical protein
VAAEAEMQPLIRRDVIKSLQEQFSLLPLILSELSGFKAAAAEKLKSMPSKTLEEIDYCDLGGKQVYLEEIKARLFISELILNYIGWLLPAVSAHTTLLTLCCSHCSHYASHTMLITVRCSSSSVPNAQLAQHTLHFIYSVFSAPLPSSIYESTIGRIWKLFVEEALSKHERIEGFWLFNRLRCFFFHYFYSEVVLPPILKLFPSVDSKGGTDALKTSI